MFTGLAAFVTFVIGAVIGEVYGRSAEQKIVAKVLAYYHNAGSDIQKFVQQILGSLDVEYSKIYDKAVADYDKVKRAL